MNKSNNLTKRRLRGSYLISLLSVTLVLFVLSLFSSLVFYASNISDYLKENIGFEIVVKKGVKESDILDFKKTLDKKPFVKSSEYISKEEATKRLSADLGEDIIDWLGDVENPLLPSIDVRLKADYANTDSIKEIEEWVMNRKIVKEVVSQKSLIHSINKNINRIGIVILIIGATLLIMAVTLIGHTVRLSVYSQRFAVRSMQLVGATDGFIMKPFMKNFVFQGLIGSLLSLVIQSVFLIAAMRTIPELKIITSYRIIFLIYLSVIVLGVLLTTLSTYFSLKKYLHADIDELYD